MTSRFVRPCVALGMACEKLWLRFLRFMNITAIEQELSELKKRVEQLEISAKPGPKLAWLQIIGTSKGDDLDREAARLGAEWRQQENKQR